MSSSASRLRFVRWSPLDVELGIDLVYMLLDTALGNSFSAISRFVSRCAIRPTSAYSRSVSAANAAGRTVPLCRRSPASPSASTRAVSAVCAPAASSG